jgi:hypothetical protein
MNEPDNDTKQTQGLAMWTAGCFITLALLLAGGGYTIAFGVGGPIVVAGVIRFCQGIE